MPKGKLEIKVGTTTNPERLSQSIILATAEGLEIVIAAIGPAAVAQAVKAVAIANKKGETFLIKPWLADREIKDADSGQAILLVVTMLGLVTNG